MAGRQPIEPIRLVPPVAGSLLQSVAAVPGEWRTGVSFDTREWFQATWPDCAPAWETCSGETLVDKPLGSSDAVPDCDQVSFDPFTIYTPVSEVSTQPDLARRLSAEVRAAHEALLSATVAKVLTGQDTLHGIVTALPFCVDTGLNATLPAVDQSLGLTHAPLTSFALLLRAYAAEMGTTGGAMIHCSPVVLPFLMAHGIVAQVGQRFVSPGGVIVVADAGYATIGTQLSSTMYVTGPVEVALSAAVEIPGSETEDARLNQWALVIEQRVIYRFEPRSVFSITTATPVPTTAEV